MSYNQQNQNNQQQNKNQVADLVKKQAINLAKKVGKKAIGGLIAKIGAALLVVLAPILIVLVLISSIISLFIPDLSWASDGTSDEEMRERLNEYLELASEIEVSAEWLIAMDMATHENMDLLDINISENAYHFFSVRYRVYTSDYDDLRDSWYARGKEELKELFSEYNAPLDDIPKALKKLRDKRWTKLDIYPRTLDSAIQDAGLNEEQIEHFNDILEFGYIPEMFKEYGITYVGNLSMGSAVSCTQEGQLDRERIESILGNAGVLKNHTDTFITTAERYGIDPVLFIAIALHESGNGSSDAVVNKNNPGGLMNPSTNSLYVFDSLEDGIDSMGRTLHNRIIGDGLITIEQLGSKYAPVGAANDPNNLNIYWVPNVSSFVNILGGLTMNCSAYSDQSIVFDGDVNEAQKTVATVGLKWIGNSKYVFGGGRNQKDIQRGYFDCSSFVHWAFAQAGINLGPLTSTSTETLNKKGKKISMDEIRVGDLIFWDTYKKDGHVGIYIGDGKFIGAQSDSGVSIVSVNAPYWTSHFSGHVRRILE